MADLDDDERSGRTWTLLAALAVVVIIVAVGGWLVISGNHDDDDNSTAATGGSAPSNYVGPRAIEGGVPVGFAHTPAGSQAAAAAWASYGLTAPWSRMAPGVTAVFDPPELLGTPDPQDDTWFSTSPVAVTDGVAGDAGVVRVLVVKTQLLDNDTDSVAISLLELAMAMEWMESESDWRVTQVGLLNELVPPLTRSDFEGYDWLGPVSYQVAGPLFSS